MAWNHDAIINTPKVALCLPHTGEVTTAWAHRTWGPLVYSRVTFCMKKPLMANGVPVAVARESLAEAAIQDGADYIFFIDSDIIAESPDDINEVLSMLIEDNLPIVSGMYRAKKYNMVPWAMWKHNEKTGDFKPIVSWNKPLINADVAGMGCMLIKFEVFKNTPKPWFRWDALMVPSEDFFFLLKAKKAGYNTVIDTRIRCSHINTIKMMPSDIPSFENIDI
jgi:hypothetical protein